MSNYTQSNNSVSSTYQQFFLSKVPVGEDYIIFAVDGYYMCVYGDYSDGKFNDSTIIRISRQTGSNGTVSYLNESSTTVDVNYEYYTYSNIGTGTLLVSPHQTNNQFNISNYTFICIFAFILLYLGFNVIKKRWIR